ncbi:hypothetical protein ACOMHN_001884 [Nucella lapillus]
MSWKYVLVSLALALQGNLLIVESRESEEYGGAGEEDSVLSSLREFLTQRRTQVDPDASHSDMEGGGRVDDVEASERDLVPDSSKGSNLHAGGGRGQGSRGADKPQYREVKGQRSEPLALALRQTDANSGARHSHKKVSFSTSSIAFIMIVAGCTVLAAVGVVGAGVCWYKYNRGVKSASVVDYPAYGVTGPTGKEQAVPSPGDRKLAQSAQMYHYQHQKQQMIAMEKSMYHYQHQKQQMIAMEKANGSMKHDASDEESEEDNVEGDYTVYECPGLAPTGEMEVKNPLFRGDETPTSTTPVAEETTTPVAEETINPPQDK